MKFAILFLLQPIFSVGQTFNIIRVTPNKITVGADSKTSRNVLYIDNSGKRRMTKIYSTTHKILNVGHIYYMIAGTGDSAVRTLPQQIFKKDSSFDKLVSIFSVEMNKALNQQWESARNIDTAYYSQNIEEAEVIFFSFEHGRPIAVWLFYKPLSSNPLIKARFSLDYSVITNTKRGNFAMPMGYNEGMIGRVTNEATWAGKIPEAVIRQLIKAQIKRAPKIIGEPIDVMEMTKDGVKWLPLKRK